MTSLSLNQEILVEVTLLFGALGREDKIVRIRCVILPNLPYSITIGGLEIAAYDLLADMAVLAAFKKQGHWNAIKKITTTDTAADAMPSTGATKKATAPKGI